MKKLLILSGKGGTGKTTIAAAFIRFADAKAFADADVEAPNLHLVSGITETAEQSPYYGSKIAVIDEELCDNCGVCIEKCLFDALYSDGKKVSVSTFSCEGCGVCSYVCPRNAVTLKDDESGIMSLYKGRKTFSTAELKIGRGNSGKLVSAVKTHLYKAAPNADLVIIDGPPGIGCPVIASMRGADLVLIVTEPSVSGISDLKRLMKTAAVFQTKIAVCVNKYDVSAEKTEEIKKFCDENGILFAGVIPYDKTASLMSNKGLTLADADNPARDSLKRVFDNTIDALNAS